MASHFNKDDSGSNKDGKRKEVLECSSRSSVSETEESLLTPSSNPNPTSSPLETNSSPISGQPKNQSRNEITMGASSLLQIWEARSQPSSSNQSQSLIGRRRSSGLSLFDNLSYFPKPLNNEAKNNSNGDQKDWWSQLERSHVSDSNEKEEEGRHFLGMVTCTPRIRGRQAFEDLFKKILHDRKEELKSIASSCQVSELSSHRSSQLQFMLKIRCLERGIAIQERQWLKRRDGYKTNTGKVNSVVEGRISSSSVASRENKVEEIAKKAAEKNVLQENTEEVKETMEKRNMREAQEATCKTEIYKKASVSEDTSNKNGLKEPEKEGEMSREAVEKAIAKEKVEGNKTPLSIADKVNLWDSKSKAGTNRRKTPEKAKNEEKTARRVTYVETTEREIKEVSSFERGKSIKTEEYGVNPQEVIPVICMDKRKEEETRSQESSESGQEEQSSQENEETLKAEKLEALERLYLILESPKFLSGWDEDKMEVEEEEEEEDEQDFNGENVYYDWVSNISRPRSYWEDLRKQWELEVMNYGEAEKEEIKDMINERTVTKILASDLREEINNILISQAQRLEVESNPVEEQNSEESLVECSESNHEQVEEQDTISDGFSQSSSRSAMIMMSFEDQEAAVAVSSSPKDHDNTSYEFKMICDLKEQIEKLQREMLELRRLVESASGVDMCDERL